MKPVPTSSVKKKEAVSSAAILTDIRPVILDNKIIGKVEISLTTANVKHDLLEDVAKQLLGLGAQVLFSFALIWLLFDRRIIRPIQILQQETARLASGQMEQPLAWTRQDEIGNLAQGLNKMRLNLGELIAGREHQNALLQQELAERLRVEQILRETEEKFIAIFQASPVAMTVFRKNPTYRMADVNDAWGAPVWLVA